MSVARGSWEISAVNQGKNQGSPLAWIYRRLPPNLVRETGDAKLQTSFYSLFRSQKHSSVFTPRAFCSHGLWGIIKCSIFFCIFISPSFFVFYHALFLGLGWKHCIAINAKACCDKTELILTHSSPQSTDFQNISKFYCRDATKLGPRCF